MVIGNSHVRRLPVIPTEYQAPLLIDSHTPAALEIAGKGFQPIAGRNPQIGQKIGCVKLPESQKRPFLNFSGQSFRPAAVPDLFGFLT